MRIRVNYIETVWNGYIVNGFPEDDYEESFEYILKNNYDGNVWKMADDIKGMTVELNECCFDFIETDYEKVDCDY